MDHEKINFINLLYILQRNDETFTKSVLVYALNLERAINKNTTKSYT